jgi:GTP-binding protein HflX
MHFIERHQGGERAVLVFVHQGDKGDYEEFVTLATSTGIEVVEQMVVSRQRFDPTYLIGKGKLEQLAAMVKAGQAEVVIFSRPLTPAQGRNLEKATGVRVLDRTEMILDIFAARARSYEGRLQVELAQLEHLSSRLVRGWTHLERQKGGIGLRGPGETQLETDRRLLGLRIKAIKRALEKVVQQREQSRRARRRQEVPTIALVGYTNAGKSTLFNQMTKADVYAKDQLFATLDPTLRRIRLPNWGDVIVADTVGFVNDLPHSLVAAFRATLEEVCQASLLLHVVDAADERRPLMIQAVNEVLAEIGADEIPQLMVYNKIDLRDSVSARIDYDESHRAKRVWVSAQKNQGIALLQEAILDGLKLELSQYHLCLPQERGDARSYLYNCGVVKQEEMTESGQWQLTLEMDEAAYQKFLGRFGLN